MGQKEVINKFTESVSCKMKIERTKNTISGFAWGATGKIVNIVLPFALRTIIIYKLGVEYLGLSSLFASILQVLSMSELGFSTV